MLTVHALGLQGAYKECVRSYQPVATVGSWMRLPRLGYCYYIELLAKTGSWNLVSDVYSDGICNFNNHLSQYNFDKVKIVNYQKNMHPCLR